MADYLYVLRAERAEMLKEGPTLDEAGVLEAHAAYLRDLVDAGTVILFGRTQEASASAFGLVVFEAESDDVAREVMEADPAVLEGIMRAELFPYRIAGLRGATA